MIKFFVGFQAPCQVPGAWTLTVRIQIQQPSHHLVDHYRLGIY